MDVAFIIERSKRLAAAERHVGPAIICAAQTIVGGGSGAAWIEALVVRGVLYPDATRNPVDGPTEGYADYILRLASDGTADWDYQTTYAIGNPVIGSDGRKYTSLVDNNTGNDPINSPAQWQAEAELSAKVRNYEDIADLRRFMPHYKTDETVLLYKKGEVYYFLNQMICVANENLSGSLRWRAEDRRMMAVFK